MKIDNRIWIILTILACGVLVAGGWFLGAQPQLDAASAANTLRQTAASHNQELQTELTSLQKAQTNLPLMLAQASRLEQSIPSDNGSAAFIKSLNALAAASGVTIDSIKVDDSAPYAPPVAAADTTPTATASGSGSSTPAPTPSPSATADAAAAPAAPTGAPLPTTDDLITASNFVVVPVTVEVVGPWKHVLAFIKGLQSGPRLVLVTGIQSSKSADGDSYKTVVSASIYALRDPSRPKPTTDDSTDPAPDPTDTPSPTDTPAPSGTPLPSTTPAPSTTPKP